MADEQKTDEEEVILCPHCKWPLRREDISVVVFSKAMVLACPACKKTIYLHPKF